MVERIGNILIGVHGTVRNSEPSGIHVLVEHDRRFPNFRVALRVQSISDKFGHRNCVIHARFVRPDPNNRSGKNGA